jgi:RNA polymerase sigma-70 factor (ECF subfamily)
MSVSNSPTESQKQDRGQGEIDSASTRSSLSDDPASMSEAALAAKRKSVEEDRAMIKRVQRGDAAAFNDLIVKYEKVVFNFAFRLTHNYDDANDIAQDAFIRAYNAIASFRGDSAFSTWIFRITTNVFLDDRKKRKAHPQQSLDEFASQEDQREGMQVVDPGPTPEQIVALSERQHMLVNAIQSLPEHQKAMVVMYHLHQKSYEEIAEVFDLPIGTVKSRLNRARLALKENLKSSAELFPN